MLRCNLRILAAYFLEHALPQPPSVRHGVGLIAHQNFLARLAVELGVLLAILESVANDALHAFSRVDVLLGSDFVRRALLEHAAGVGVKALRVFAQHDEIQVLGLDSLQWTQRGIEQANWTHVGIQIHFEPHAEQNFLGMNVRLDPRISERTHQNRIEVAAEHGKAIRRHSGLIPQVAVGSPVEIRQFNIGARCLDHLRRLGNDFLPYAVSGDDGDALPAFLFRVHDRKVNTIVIIELSIWGLHHCRTRARDLARPA